MKKLKLEEENEGMPITALREIRLLQKLSHKNIVNLLDVVTSKRILSYYEKIRERKIWRTIFLVFNIRIYGA